MKTTLAIVAGLTIMVAAITNRTSINPQQRERANKQEVNVPLNKGAYLASEFVQFKKENLPEYRNIPEPVSEKVLFKAFVIHKKAQ